MDILIKAGQLILSLSILVIFHEFGHFFFAKLFKTKVEKFYLFFNPWFQLFKFTKGDTEYGVGWVPLGGYVKIAGMIDESMDKEQMKQPAQPWEFRSKPAWQRLLIMVGGVLVNILLAMAIYVMILFTWGEEYLPTENVKHGIWVTDSLGKEIGLKNGDKILTVSNKKVEDFKRIIPTLILNHPSSLQIERKSEIINIEVSDAMVSKIIKHGSSFIDPRIPFIAGDFLSNSVAKKAGMQTGDKIVGLNKQPIFLFDDFRSNLDTLKNKDIVVTVDRKGTLIDLSMKVPADGYIGVRPFGKLTEYFVFKKLEYGFFESIPAGIAKGFREVRDYLKQLKLIFTPKTEAYKSLGGFIAIGNIFPAHWDWLAFWTMTALLSIMLGVVNILPIPALDGGHVMFLLFEIITRRKPSEKFMEYAQIGGMVLLLALVIFANGNDIVKLFK